MSLEKNKAIVRSLFEAFNKKDLASLDELLAPDFVDHTHRLQGRARVKVAAFRNLVQIARCLVPKMVKNGCKSDFAY